mgnify:FL=1
MSPSKKVTRPPEKMVSGIYRAALVLLYIGIAALAFGTAALALVSRRVLDEGGSPWGWALLFLALALPLLDGGLDLLSGRMVDRAAAALRRDTLEQLLRKDAESYNRYHSGQVFSRLTQDAYTVCEWRITGRPQVTGQLIRLICAASALFLVNIPLAIAVVAAGALVTAGGRLLRKHLTRRHLRVRQADERLTGCTQEILEHMELLRSTAAGKEAVRRFEGRQKEWLRERARLRIFTTEAGTGFSSILQLGYAVLLVWGGAAIRGGRISFGDLAALLQLLAMFQSPLTGLSGVQSRLAAVRAAETRLDELYSLPEEAPGQPAREDDVFRAIVFENVTFSYEGEDQPVLREFSARLPLDRWTCLMGMSGSGKSTLFRLILGLYHPQQGRVYLETERGDIPCSAAVRDLFGYVPQTPWLFSGSIRENLLLAKPDADDAALWDALERAQCSFVRDLPDRLGTVLNEEGGGLSAGQRQRIAIARAMLSAPRFLLLDEITSALDENTEAKLLTELTGTYPAAVFATHHSALPGRLNSETLHLEGIV